MGRPHGGSSPLTRGQRDDQLVDRHVPGVIPAHAGSTTISVVAIVHSPGHPRSRGVNTFTSWPKPCVSGSSPLTRGQRTRIGNDGLLVGVIPAHAGSTHSKPRNPAVAITLAAAADITAHL